MKTNFVCAALACAALALSFTAAIAKVGEPISGIPIGLEGDPGSIVIARGVTDAGGSVSFGDLKPGKYVLVIDGPSLVAAIDRLVPAAPEKKESHSSFSLGFGGFSSGGGSSYRSSGGGGAGPVGGAPGGSSHGNSSSSSGGGMGVGMSVPMGDSDPHAGLRAPIWVWIAMSAGYPSGDPNIGDNHMTRGRDMKADGAAPLANTMNFEMPYCRDVAGQGMRIEFTVPGGSPAQTNVFSEDPRVVGISLGASW